MPVYGDMLRGAFFVDAGKADEEVTNLNFNNLRVAIGFGFRAKVPFMGNSVVSVDFGFPISGKSDNDNEQSVTFNFGGR
jgi:outer membrane protein assembly factor BamA